jgi:hypothetical protein
MAASKANDLVISYLVHHADVDEKAHRQLQEALEAGYRVVDLLSTAATVGGTCSGHGSVVVTAYLTKDIAGSVYCRNK